MRQNIFLKAVAAATLFASSFVASAALITSPSGTGTVGALSLNQSFESFYNYSNGNRFSSNTGLEIASTLVAFVAEYNNESALFMLFSGPTGNAGNVSFEIVGSEGGVGFVDDPAEFDGTQLSLTYQRGKTDGLIFNGLTSDDWNIDVVFAGFDGLDGISFLTFDDQGQSSILFETEVENFSISSVTTAVQQANAPSVLAFLALGLCFIAYRKKF